MMKCVLAITEDSANSQCDLGEYLTVEAPVEEGGKVVLRLEHPDRSVVVDRRELQRALKALEDE